MKIFEAYTKAYTFFIQFKEDSPGYNVLCGHRDMYYPIIKNTNSFDLPNYLKDLVQYAIDFPDHDVYLLLDEWRRVRKL